MSVTGVLHNYDVDTVPEKVSRAALPALIVAPVLDDTRRRKFSELDEADQSLDLAIARSIEPILKDAGYQLVVAG